MLAGVYTHYISYISSSGPGIGRHVVIPHYNLYIDEGLRIHIRKTEKYDDYDKPVIDAPHLVIAMTDKAEQATQKLLEAKLKMEEAQAAFEAAKKEWINTPSIEPLKVWLHDPALKDDSEREMDHAAAQKLLMIEQLWVAICEKYSLPFTLRGIPNEFSYEYLLEELQSQGIEITDKIHNILQVCIRYKDRVQQENSNEFVQEFTDALSAASAAANRST
jgi:hypothetical protein